VWGVGCRQQGDGEMRRNLKFPIAVGAALLKEVCLPLPKDFFSKP